MISYQIFFRKKKFRKIPLIFDSEKWPYIQILQSLRRLFIILVGLTMTWFSEKMLISNIFTHGLMPTRTKNLGLYLFMISRHKKFRQVISFWLLSEIQLSSVQSQFFHTACAVCLRNHLFRSLLKYSKIGQSFIDVSLLMDSVYKRLQKYFFFKS